MYYTQTAYPNVIQGKSGKYSIAEIGCFLTSFCNLLADFGVQIDPPTLNHIFVERNVFIDVDDHILDDLGWQSICAYDGHIQVSEVGPPGTWPSSHQSIVKFYYKSPRSGMWTTHFCKVADAASRTIIDPWDGKIKQSVVYGDPVGWATYTRVQPQPIKPVPVPTQPTQITVQNPDTIKYETLTNPLHMVVSKPGGANKWNFGNAWTWNDLSKTAVELVPEGTEVWVMAIAHHPVLPTGAVFYMDATATGDLGKTGKPAKTVGFNRQDLTAWTLRRAVAPAQPAPVIEEPQAPTDSPLAEAVHQADSTWKGTYTAAPNVYRALNRTPIMIHDLSGARPAVTLPVPEVGKERLRVHIAGAFNKDGKTYLRSVRSADNGDWYGFPPEMLQLESEYEQEKLYDTNTTVKERQALHTLKARDYAVIAEAYALKMRNQVKKVFDVRVRKNK